MYTEFFGLNEKPFSITPDPRYLYLSRRHADALAHLIYGISESGGFIQLTGEVGTGKTTLIRTLLQQLPDKAEIALVLNPQLTAAEFLQGICDELGISVPERASVRTALTALNAYLLDAHAQGRRVVLIVDEAQTLPPDLLEQVRLLTNLETATQKLLQIILIGQPELREVLGRPEMRQLAQRVTGRYHLEPLGKGETEAYLRHRLRVAGCQRPVFEPSAVAELYRRSGGIPRLINVVADRALLAGYSRDRPRIDRSLVKRAAAEVFGREGPRPRRPWTAAAAVTGAVAAGAGLYLLHGVKPAGQGATARLESRAATGLVARPAADTAVAALDAAEAAKRRAAAAPPAAGTGTGAGTGIGNGTGIAAAAAVPAAPAPSATAPGSPAPEDAPAKDRPSAEAGPGRVLSAALSAGGADESNEAFARLFGLWGAHYDPARGDPCAQAAEQNLRCLTEPHGSIGELRTLNRPAILTVRDAAGAEHRVLLRGLGYADARLWIGGKTVVASVSELTNAWYGRQTLLWRPAASGAELRPGIRSSNVAWLRRSLAKIEGRALDGEPSLLYDAALEAEVRRYQRERMLTVDGIVGARTEMSLASDLGVPGTPTLHED